jgi:rhodanese-related sulfurtransferase
MKRHVRIVLGLLALAAGTLAAIAGSVVPPPAADEVSAVVLAQWIRDRRPGLLVVDARAAEAFDLDRLPSARPIADIDADALRSADTVVVYADGRAEADALHGLSNGLRVLRLQGGLAAWNEEVIFPVLRADAGARQQRDFATRATLSRYFGGSPHLLNPGASAARARSRKGC